MNVLIKLFLLIVILHVVFAGCSDTSSDDTSPKKPSIDWSKITKSPAFIIIIVLLSILAGGVFFYYVLWPMIRTRLDGVPVASESELKIPEGGGGGKDN